MVGIVLSITPANAYKFHPFYVSVTEVSHNARTRSIEVSCKMFAEDIENVLKQNYKASVDLTNNNLQAENNRLMNDYMLKHLSFSIDLKPTAFKFVGFEKEKESVYCYLEVANVPSLKKISISNSILYDFKKEQINIIHVMVDGKRQSVKIDYPQNQANFSF
ncbi:MAG: hypothetical protein JWR18_626 [Segetibacter sp.]|nr:hypothetical protein [Segetibacter sp.]